jgi:hypothetical protein
VPRFRGSSQSLLFAAILAVFLSSGCSTTAPPKSPVKSTPAPKPQPVQPAPGPAAPHPVAGPPIESPAHQGIAATPAHHHAAVHPAAPATPSDSYALGDEIEAWKNSLLSGAIEYRVPTTMIAQQASTVTVVIHGFQDTQSRTLPDATGTGTLKVSSQMKVELLAPLNPGEFTLATQDTQPIQFVPNDGFATWIWNVTPTDRADNQQLQIRVSLVYQGASGDTEQIIEEKIFPVSVNVQKLSVTVEQSFWKDPIAWFRYMLPGGAGWAALAALASFIAGLGWWKRKKNNGKKAAAPDDSNDE